MRQQGKLPFCRLDTDVITKKNPSREMCRSGLYHSQRMDGAAVPWTSDMVEATEPQPGDEGLTTSTITLTAASAGPGKANTRYPPLTIKEDAMLSSSSKVQCWHHYMTGCTCWLESACLKLSDCLLISVCGSKHHHVCLILINMAV